MRFHQRRFFAYLSGAPNLHTLSSVSSHSYTLVTTDRCVSLLGYGDAGYSLHKLEVDALRTGKADVVASAVIERPVTRQSRVAITYAVGDELFLQVLAPHHESLGNENGCRTEWRCLLWRHGVLHRLHDGVWFAAFFPELATFTHTILAVDVFTSPERDQGWVVFGCADGLVRVFHGSMQRGCLGGPFMMKDLQLNGPVTSVALFPKQKPTTKESTSTWHCNLLVTCAIGQAVVYEDLYSTSDKDRNSEVLVDSDTFDSIFAGITADIDMDGEVELLLGTDSQVMLAYGDGADGGGGHEAVTEDAMKSSHEINTDESTTTSPTSLDSSHNIWNELETISVAGEEVHPLASESSLVRRRKWQRLSRSQWDLETFGAIYSLLWRDINRDGVPELLIASSTGIYVYEADPVFVIDKLERVLASLHTS
ncbi:hypothetical protein PC118_g11315 [Phytophthora cactorum]|uniref:Uncharacterized protein n=1 Tax=Phytophthora cactorum TaxID=29920 RepID=A0A8T1C9R8_9STRA|nr:hypothetical protein PC115_g10992 [Phytophthora cactorum]KAG2980177.1 hypothetical protein PC118_g11315 [Phytophthora cactorum]KAG3017021.1 hypothetical protein PC120_g11282 [Phytophthora cactorum]KAG4053803.1 hypothetical protein PC123_g11056 [Phytophthora cactorum]